MKKIVLLFLAFCQIINAQNSTPCKTSVTLDYEYEGYLELYNEESASYSFARVRNNVQDDEYLEIEITECSSSRFKVNIHMQSIGFPFRMENVYIKKEHLITLARAIDYPMPLYSHPSLSSKIVTSIENSYGYKYDVLDCYNDWLKVTFVDNKNQRHTGWMAKKYQCPNVYNACMGG